MDTDKIIKQLAAVLRTAIKEVEGHYAHCCAMLSVAVDNNLSIKREDVQQKKWDFAQMVWDDIYNPQIKKLKRILKDINAHQEKNESK